MLLHEVMMSLGEKYGDNVAVVDRYNNFTCTYKELEEYIKKFSMGLRTLGITKGEHMAQFSENSPRWLVADQGLISCGCVNAIRGSQAPIPELEYIYQHSDSICLITDSKKLIDHWSENEERLKPRFLIYIGADTIDKTVYRGKCPIYTFDEIIAKGEGVEYVPVEMTDDDVATIIYSSGTTGQPKGAMLTHANLYSQIRDVDKSMELKFEQNVLSVLPIWHAYERTAGYYMLFMGSKIFYTNPKNFKNDLKKNKIVHIVAVPRLWEAVYKGIIAEIQNKPAIVSAIIMGLIANGRCYAKCKRFLKNNYIYNETPNFIERIFATIEKGVRYPLFCLADKIFFTKLKKIIGFDTILTPISGGGALPPHIAEFYEAMDCAIIVGYGMTETSPILSVSRPYNNKIYSAGQPLINTEFLVVNPETFEPLKQGQKGLVLAKGPQVMKGYYKDEENTKKMLLPNGYINTGDLGWLCKDGSIVLSGRMKDIIVLSNGENIESEAIEEACLTSDCVDQIILTGQDQSALSALVVPNIENINKHYNASVLDINYLNGDKELKLKILKELQSNIKNRPNYRAFERLCNINFINECTVENGMMTQTLKIKKNIVCEKYKDKIENMYVN